MTKNKKKIKKSKQQQLPQSILRDNVGDTLLVGKVYEGTVISSGKHSFVVSIDQRFQVLVYAQRFVPSSQFPDRAVTCFVACGDKVLLTVIPKVPIGEFSEEWVAVKCWTEKEHSLAAAPPTIQFFIAKVTAVTALAMHMGHHPVIVIARSESIELFGYAVANVDLTLLFKEGDELQYEPAPTSDSSDINVYAKRAWFGSFVSDAKKGPTNEQRLQCLDFCKARGLPKATRVMLMVRGDGNQKEEVDDFSEEELDLKYIKPSKHPPVLNQKQQIAAYMAAKTNSGLSSPQAAVEPLGGQTTDLDRRRPDENRVNRPTTVDAATQTYSVGDIACFYAIAIE